MRRGIDGEAFRKYDERLAREGDRGAKVWRDYCDDCTREEPGALIGKLITIPADSDGGFGSPETSRVLCRTCAHELGLELVWLGTITYRYH